MNYRKMTAEWHNSVGLPLKTIKNFSNNKLMVKQKDLSNVICIINGH